MEEYDYNCVLEFKGTYKDGKRISGIEFNSHEKKIFEGVYHNNLRWIGNFYSPDEKKINKIKKGNGKDIEEYDSNGELIFKGKFKNGKRFNGKGKEFYKQNGNIKFEGKYQNFNYYKGTLYNINGKMEYKGLLFMKEKMKFYYSNKMKRICLIIHSFMDK